MSGATIVRARYRALDPGLADLERAGLVAKGQSRPAPSGRPEVTWWPGADAEQGVLL